MLYFVALLLPWVAVFLSGRVGQGVISLVAWLVAIPLLFVFGLGVAIHGALALHALFTAHDHYADERMARFTRQLNARILD